MNTTDTVTFPCPGCAATTDFMIYPRGNLLLRNCFLCGDETVFEVES